VTASFLLKFWYNWGKKGIFDFFSGTQEIASHWPICICW
jgi:hypothetical protein